MADWAFRNFTFEQDRLNSIGVTSPRMDEAMNRIYNYINQCWNVKNPSFSIPTVDIPMGAQKFTNLGPGINPGDSINLSQLQANGLNYGNVTGGIENNFEVTTPLNFNTLTAGMVLCFESDRDITGDCTIDWNEKGAYPVKVNPHQNAEAYSIQHYQMVEVIFDGEYFYLLSAVPGTVTQNGLAVYGGTSVGGLNTYDVALLPPIQAYNEGMVFRFKPHVSNTGGATLNVSSVGAKPIYKNGSGVLQANDILLNQIVEVVYNSQSGGYWSLTSPYRNSVNIQTGTGLTGGPIYNSGTISLNMNLQSGLGLTGGPITNGSGTLALGAGTIVQVVSTSTSTPTNVVSIIPLDNTIPTNLEGALFLSLAITPKKSDSLLRITFTGMAAISAQAVIALFRSGQNNAIASAFYGSSDVYYSYSNISLEKTITSTTTLPLTFSIRVGTTQVGGGFYINQGAATPYLGGTINSTLTIQEILQ